MKDHYLPREYITLPKVHLQRHGDQVSVTYHQTGHQTVIASEDFAAAAIDGWAIHMLATERRIAQAVAIEREACAAVVERHQTGGSYNIRPSLAAAIRERKP